MTTVRSVCGRLAYEVRKSAVIRPVSPLSNPARSIGSLARQANEIISRIARVGTTRLFFEGGALQEQHPFLTRLSLRWDNVKIGSQPAVKINALFGINESRTINFRVARIGDEASRVFATPAEFRTFADKTSTLVMVHLSEALKILQISLGLNVVVGASKNHPILRVNVLLMGAQIK